MDFYELLDSAYKKLLAAEHIYSVILPVVNDKRLLIKILEQLHLSLLNSINALLRYEYAKNGTALYKDPKLNFRTFLTCCSKYGITQNEVDRISEIFILQERHKKSPMEFVKNEKFVILSDDLATDTLSIEQIRGYLGTARNIFKKTDSLIKRHQKVP